MSAPVVAERKGQCSALCSTRFRSMILISLRPERAGESAVPPPQVPLSSRADMGPCDPTPASKTAADQLNLQTGNHRDLNYMVVPCVLFYHRYHSRQYGGSLFSILSAISGTIS